MKNNLVKFYITALFLCCTLVTFAQPGVVDETDGDTTPAASIDGYVWILAAIGLLFVFFSIRSYYKQVANSEE